MIMLGNLISEVGRNLHLVLVKIEIIPTNDVGLDRISRLINSVPIV
jgi:hypothetical protein